MTDPVIPDIPPAPVVPPYPALGAPNFNQMAYDVGTSMPGVVSGINAIALAARECAQASKAYAQQVAGSVGDADAAAATATEKAAAAASSADDAAGSEQAAAGHAGAAAASAGAAAGSASDALESKNAAAGSATASADSATNSANSALEAKGYRDQAQVFATQQLKASSTSSVTPGAGAKTFTIETGRSFVPGMYLVATSTGSPGTQMSGPVQSYDPATGALVIAVDTFSGAAARADWVIGVAAKGANGMAQQLVTGDMVAVPGVVYVFTVAAATLKLPETGLSDDSEIAFVLATDVSRNQVVDFGALPFRGMLAGKRFLNKRGFALGIRFNTTLGGWV